MYKSDVGEGMHRTQIYLDEHLVQEIKKVAKMQNITMSAFIRNVIKKELQKYKKKDFVSFIENLEPLESFKDVDAQEYVEEIRNRSRILQK